jgi:hypothetical protein
MKLLAAIVITTTLWGIQLAAVRASCYSYIGSRQERIELQDKQNGYLRVWATKDLKGKMVGKLKHGEVIKTLKFVDNGVCGGSIYIQFRNSKGKMADGWVFSDALIGATKP